MLTLAIVSPCYNEEQALETASHRISQTVRGLIAKGKISEQSFILYVNDGSTDSTWQIIRRLSQENSLIRGISLGVNVGHQTAIMAGMMTAKDSSDAVITIDADLQDDLLAIEKMVDEHLAGNDIVYGVKVKREADPVIKRLTAEAFYKGLEKMGLKTVYNHADFRLMSRRTLDYLSLYRESNIYLRGIVTGMGFPSTTVEEEIRPREAGESKYTVSKMLNLALDGVTSFSIKPIHWVLNIGVAYLVVSLLVAIYVCVSLLMGLAVSGWASIMLSIWLMGGSMLVALGIIGLYVGKTYMETKQRPRYNIIEKTF